MKDVLFICKSNINRSQMAEGFYNNFVKGKKAISAALELEKDLQKTSEKGIILMTEKGVVVSKQKSDLLNKKMLNNVKKIVVVCPKHFVPKYVLDFGDVEFWRLRDPHYHGMDERRKIRDDIEKRVKKLVKEIRK